MTHFLICYRVDERVCYDVFCLSADEQVSISRVREKLGSEIILLNMQVF